MNVPKIRFKEFSQEWYTAQLGELGKTYSGVGFPEKEQGGRIGIPFYKVSDMNNVGNETVMTNSNNYVTTDQINSNRWKLSSYPAIFFAKVGAAVLLNRKRLVLAPSLCDNNTMMYCLNPEKWNDYFCLKLFDNIDLASLAQTGSLPSYNGTMVERISVCLPLDISEQNKIAYFFKNMDSLIESTDKKIALLKQTKQACLQSMFPQLGETRPRVRFKGFIKEWDKKKIGEISTSSKGNGYSKSDLRDNGVPIVLYGRMYTRYSFEMDNIDTFATHKDSAVYSKGNEVVIPASGETAEDIAVAAAIKQKGVILGGDLNVLTFSDNYLPSFMALCISNTKTHYELSRYAQGKSVVHLRNNDIAKGTVFCPCLEEQQQIASFFSNLDKQINSLEQRLKKLMQIKETSLEKMFV